MKTPPKTKEVTTLTNSPFFQNTLCKAASTDSMRIIYDLISYRSRYGPKKAPQEPSQTSKKEKFKASQISFELK